LNVRRAGCSVSEHNSPPERLKGESIGNSLNLNEVGLGMLEFRVSEPVGQLTIVGQEDQTFAVAIESARRVDARNLDMILEGLSSFGVGELAENVIGLVESEISESIPMPRLLPPGQHAILIASLERSQSH
jgi:hypothetical protein